MLIGLDLSAAFDTVDHSLLIERLQLEFGVIDTALDWLRSYLVDRVQFVKMGQHQSDKVALDVGVPQGSVLGPLLFAVHARMQIFVQLSPTVTKLCHIKCDHPACVSVDGRHSHYGGRA